MIMKKIELINLTLDEIRRSVSMISEVQNCALNANKDNNKVLQELSTDCDNILEEARIKLRDVLENVAEFQNAKDMICGVDVALTDVSYSLIYERKKECDYE